MDPELEDDDAVELSRDMQRAIDDEERAKAAASSDDDEQEDDDDSDLGDDGDTDDDVGASDDDSEDDSDDDDSDDGDDPKLKKTDVPAVPKKKPSKAQERIEELAKKRREAEKAAFEAEMKALELERRLEALQSRDSAPAAAPVLKEPKPDDFEYGEVDQKYIDAVVNYRIAKERAEDKKKLDEDRSASQNAERKARYQKKLKEMSDEGAKRKDLKDFDKVVNEVNFPGNVALAILDSDQAVDIAYYLGNNITKLREFTLMDPGELARNMGRLEERFSARASAGKKRSKAPETPGTRKSSRKQQADESKYGPADQDAFDKAFFQR